MHFRASVANDAVVHSVNSDLGRVRISAVEVLVAYGTVGKEGPAEKGEKLAKEPAHSVSILR